MSSLPFGLLVATAPAWKDAVLSRFDDLLLDHIHCEKKAAATAIGLINRYPERSGMVRRLLMHAQEELQHFHLLHELALERGLVLHRDRPDSYVHALLQHQRGNEPGRLVDALLIAALIEARSCERFLLIMEDLPTEELRRLYAALAASEAGHAQVFRELAFDVTEADAVERRYAELCVVEAEILRGLPGEARMHG